MKLAIVWLRRDLRLNDNPAFYEAVNSGYIPVPLYIHNDLETAWPDGAASRWWLHHCLASLRLSLQKCGTDMVILQGDPAELIPRVVRAIRSHSCLLEPMLRSSLNSPGHGYQTGPD